MRTPREDPASGRRLQGRVGADVLDERFDEDGSVPVDALGAEQRVVLETGVHRGDGVEPLRLDGLPADQQRSEAASSSEALP